MHVLIRRISPYTAADILLGLFCTPQECQDARKRYLDELLRGDREDPWRQQAYKDSGLREEDLACLDVSSLCVGCFSDGDRVVVVSDYSDFLGQICREIKSVVKSAAEARTTIEAINAEADDFPHYALSQEVVVSDLLSDAPDQQPRL